MRGETRCQTVLLLDIQDGKQKGLVRQGDLGGDAGGEEAFWILALLIDRRGQLRRLTGSGLVYPWTAAAPFPHHTRGFSLPS